MRFTEDITAGVAAAAAVVVVVVSAVVPVSKFKEEELAVRCRTSRTARRSARIAGMREVSITFTRSALVLLSSAISHTVSLHTAQLQVKKKK